MNQTIKGLTVEIGGDVSNLGTALKEMDGKLRSSGKELSQINSLLKFDPKNITLLAQKIDVLGGSIEAAKKKVDALKEAEKQAAELVGKGEMGEETFRELQRDILFAEQKVKSLEKELGKTEGALNAVATAAEEVSEPVKTWSDEFDSNLADLNSKMNDSKENLRDIDKLLKRDPENLTLMAQKVHEVSEQFGITKQRLDELQKKYAAAAELHVNGEYAEKDLNALERSVISAQQDVEELKRELEKTEGALKDAGNAAESSGNEIQEAGKKSTNAAKDTKELKKSVDDLRDSYKDAKDEAMDAVSEFGKTVGVIGGAVVAGGTAALTSAMSYEDALKSIEAQTGATERQMQSYKTVLDDLFAGGYGEDMDDLASSMAQVAQISGETNSAKLKQLTADAITLRDTFGFDVAESLRAATMLEKQFGVTGKEAYNLIVQGAQNGLNKNGDLLDVINEYGVHYAQLGFSAEEFFGSLQNGAEAGAFTVDKVGDAMKEFGIRIKDTGSATAEGFALLGYSLEDSEEYASGTYQSLNDLQSQFAAGGDSARAAMDTVLNKLFAMDDKVLQNQAGVALFGTMWEDLGIDAVSALVDVNTTMDRTKSSMEDIKKIKYDSVSNDWKKLGRQVQTELVAPIGEKLLPVAKKFINYASENLEDLIPTVTSLGGAIAGMMVAKKATDMTIAITKMVKAYKALKTAAVAANAAQSATPWGVIVGGIGAVVGAIAGYAAASDDATSELQELEEAFLAVADAAQESGESQRKAARMVDEEFDAYDALWDELQTLVDGNGKVKEGYEDRVSYIRSELMDATGEEIEMADGVIIKYDELCDTMDALLLKKRALRMLESQSGEYDAAVAGIDEAQKAYEIDLANYDKVRTANERMAELALLENAARVEYDGLDARIKQSTSMSMGEAEYIANRMAELAADRDAYSTEMAALRGSMGDIDFEDVEDVAAARRRMEASRLTYDSYLGIITNYETLEAATLDGSAEEIATAMGIIRNGIMTSTTASLSSLQTQERQALEAYRNLVDWSQSPNSTVTQEQLTDAFVLRCETMIETYRKMLQDGSGATAEEIATQEALLRAALEESGGFTAEHINMILALAADSSVELGEMFGEGFAQGMENSLPKIEKAGEKIARAADESTRSTLEIQSPSRVGRRIGSYFGQGIALGIDDERESTASRGARLARELAEIVSGGVARPVIGFAAEIERMDAGRANSGVAVADMEAIFSRLDRILEAVERIDPVTVLDGDTLVSKTADRTDRAIGKIYANTQRGKLV